MHLLGVPWTNTCDTLLSSHLTTEPSALTLLVGRVLCENAMRNFCLTWRRFLYSYKFLFLYFIFSMFLIELELHHLPISLTSLQLLPAALLNLSNVLHNSCYFLFLWLSLLCTSTCLFVWISIYKYNLLSPFLLLVCSWFQFWPLYIGKPIRGSSLGEATSPPSRH